MKIDQVLACYRFGDRVFDLQPGVGFDEVKVVILNQEFHGPDVFVLGRLRKFQCIFTQATPQIVTEIRGGCDFHNFLTAALEATITVAKMTDCTRSVPCNLNLDVTRVSQQFFHIQTVVTKRELRFALADFKCFV